MGNYALLWELYLGRSSNADLMSAMGRRLLHVPTRLDGLVPALLERGLDVVLTGNPGDGKSHLVRRLVEAGHHRGAEVVIDLSEARTADVVARWERACVESRRLLLCGNEGPLRDLLVELRVHPVLGERAAELLGQLRRLVVSSPSLLPAAPRLAALVDLADRELLDQDLVTRAIAQVCNETFLPDCADPWETPAGRNIELLQQPGPADRLARLISAAGRRMTEHVTFRRLWAAISFAVCHGLTEGQQDTQRAAGGGFGLSPVDGLVCLAGQGPLLESCRLHVDPAAHALPGLDEALWNTGTPSQGRWLQDMPWTDPPARLWAAGDHTEALRRFKELKRLVTLAHEAGEALVARIEEGVADLPSAIAEDSALLAQVLRGVRRSYLSAAEEAAAPPWLLQGLPAWVGVSYEDFPAVGRPHVVTTVVLEADLEIARPVRAPWIGDALGRLPELAWLRHRPSGISLRLDPPLLSALRHAAQTQGHLDPPEPLQRFMVRIAGWAERAQAAGGAARFAVLAHARGELVVAAGVTRAQGGASYASA